MRWPPRWSIVGRVAGVSSKVKLGTLTVTAVSTPAVQDLRMRPGSIRSPAFRHSSGRIDATVNLVGVGAQATVGQVNTTIRLGISHVDANATLTGVQSQARFGYPSVVIQNPPSGQYSQPWALSTEVYNPDPAGFRYTPPQVWIDTRMDSSFLSPATGKTVHQCFNTTDFNNALNAVAQETTSRPHVIVLAAGVSFTGNFTLPAKQGGQIGVWTYIISNSVYNGTFPVAEGYRVNPTAASWPVVITPNISPAIATTNAASCSHYRLIGLEVSITQTPTYWESGVGYFLNYLGLVSLGVGSALGNMPSYVYLDRCYVHGHHVGFPTWKPGIKRGIALDAKYCAVVDSFVSDIRSGQTDDAQAVWGYNGPGPFKIVNNYLEASTENVGFGGANPVTFGVIPSDIEIRRNHVYKPLEWLDAATWGASIVKNLFELKNGQRVLFEANVCEHQWLAGDNQRYADIHQVIQDSGGGSGINNLTIRHNKWRGINGGSSVASIVTYDPVPNPDLRIPLYRAEHYNNLYYDVGDPAIQRYPYGQECRFMQTTANQANGEQPHDYVWDHNTFVWHPNATSRQYAVSALAGSGLINNLTIINNVFQDQVYGGIIDGTGKSGTNALNAAASSWTFAKNAMVLPSSAGYPTNNFYPTTNGALGLDANYRVGATYQGAGTDGQDVGILSSTLEAATNGVVQGYFDYSTR